MIMAQIERFVPFILRWAVGVTQKPEESVKQLFARARRSGWSDDPLDAGGATQCDVTFATYCSYCRRKGLPVPDKSRLRNIPYEHWIEILKTMYWDRWKADSIPSQPLAEILVDWVWASGSYGITRPQKILGVTADGIVGPKTLAALNASNPETLFAKIKHDRVKFCNEIVARRPSQKKWLRGWLNRINALSFSLLLLMALPACNPCRQIASHDLVQSDSLAKTERLHTVELRTDSVHVRDSVITVIRGDTVLTDRWHTRYHERVRVDTVDRVERQTVYRTRTVTRQVAVPQTPTVLQRLLQASGVAAIVAAVCAIAMFLWRKRKI